MGVGRSGTTAIYTFLQRVLEELFPGNVDYVYEPFLWDRKTFDKPRTSISNEFSLVRSISVEGVYHHKKIPMLALNSTGLSMESCSWLSETLTAQDGKVHYLGKMIRGNGRIGLIRELSPCTRIVFVIRNPVDVLNSAVQLFSFFGSEFYESDYERFQSEVVERLNVQRDSESSDQSVIQREFEYWHLSNKAFLDFASQHPENILSFAYEAFVDDRPRLVERICKFLDLEFREDYAEKSANPVGPVRQTANGLTKAEFEFLSRKLTVYNELLGSVQEAPLAPTTSLPRIVGWCKGERRMSSEPFLNAYAASKVLKKNIAELERDNLELRRNLEKICSSRRYRMLNWLLSPIDNLRARFRSDEAPDCTYN